jgi:hypothetical protein
MTELPTPDEPTVEQAVDQLQEMREATSVTFEWKERERMMYSCRATVNRSQLQTWLNAKYYSPDCEDCNSEHPHCVRAEDVDAELLVEFLEANPGASIDERRWPADHSEVDYLDITRVLP